MFLKQHLARTEIRSHLRVPRSGTPRWLASIFTLLLPRVHESRLPRTLPAIFDDGSEGGNDADVGEAHTGGNDNMGAEWLS